MTDNAGASNDRDKNLVQLLARVAQSDQAAFKSLYLIASPIIYGVLLRMFKVESLAEDALQETFLKIWERADRYDPGQGKPLTWMTSIARYHALDVLRSRQSSVARDAAYAEELRQTADTTQSLYAQADDGQILSICLERLEPEARDCVIHAYCGGYTHHEISELTGRALGTVKSWIKRSLKSLRGCIDEFR